MFQDPWAGFEPADHSRQSAPTILPGTRVAPLPTPETPLQGRNVESTINSRERGDARADRADNRSERNQTIDNVARVRSDFRADPMIAAFGKTRTAYEALRNYARTADNPYSDLSTLFAFMKTLDDSAVQAGEQENFSNAGGGSAQLRGMLERLGGQGNLTAEAYEQILEAARQTYEPRAAYFNEQAARHRQLLSELGVPESEHGRHIPMAPMLTGGQMGGYIDDTITERPLPANPNGAEPRATPLEGGVTQTQQRTGNQEWGRGTPDNASTIRDVPDPVLRGHANRLGQMLASPRSSDEQIRAYVSEYFPHNAGTPEIEAAIRDRRNPRSELGRWIRQNRGKPVIMGTEWYTRQEQRSPAEINMGQILDTPVGTAAAQYFNSATAGVVPALAEGIGAIDDANNARAGLAGARELNPASATVGDIAGVASAYMGGRAILGAAAPGVASRLASRPMASGIGADAAYGGIRGAAESPDDPMFGLVQGAGVNALLGGTLRGGVRVGGGAIAPTGGQSAQLYAEGVQPSMGQRAGGIVNRAEQAFASVPVLGAAQRSTRERAIEQFERSVFNRALRNIPQSRVGGRSPALPNNVRAGSAAFDHSYRTFDEAYSNVHSQMRFRLDNRVQQSLVQVQQQAARLHPDSAQRFANILENDVTRVLAQNGGQLSGRDLQGVLSNIRSTVRSINKNQNGDQELVGALEGLEDALMRGAVRYSPREAVRDLRRIDRGYAQFMRAERAAISGSASREPGRFSATDLTRAERAQGNRRRFLRGDAEGANYAAAGQRLGQTVSDSGTGERAAYMAGGLGLIGGPGAAGGAVAGLSPMALLGLIPYAANTIGNAPGVRQVTNALLAPRDGRLVNGMRAGMQRFGEPLAGASAPAISDPWYGNDY